MEIKLLSFAAAFKVVCYNIFVIWFRVNDWIICDDDDDHIRFVVCAGFNLSDEPYERCVVKQKRQTKPFVEWEV